MGRESIKEYGVLCLSEVELADTIRVADDVEDALKEIQVEVRNMLTDDFLCSITVSARTLVAEAKRQVAEATGIPVNEQILLVDGRKARRATQPLAPKLKAGDVILMTRDNCDPEGSVRAARRPGRGVFGRAWEE